MINTPLSQLTQADELKQSELERAFVTRWRQFSDNCPDPVCEHEFLEDRKFRFDFAWPDVRVAVECQGIKDHATVKGLQRDCEKFNLAACHGWMVFQTTTQMLENDPGVLVGMVIAAVGLRRAEYPRQMWRPDGRGAAGADAVNVKARMGT